MLLLCVPCKLPLTASLDPCGAAVHHPDCAPPRPSPAHTPPNMRFPSSRCHPTHPPSLPLQTTSIRSSAGARMRCATYDADGRAGVGGAEPRPGWVRCCCDGALGELGTPARPRPSPPARKEGRGAKSASGLVGWGRMLLLGLMLVAGWGAEGCEAQCNGGAVPSVICVGQGLTEAPALTNSATTQV